MSGHCGPSWYGFAAIPSPAAPRVRSVQEMARRGDVARIGIEWAESHEDYQTKVRALTKFGKVRVGEWESLREGGAGAGVTKPVRAGSAASRGAPHASTTNNTFTCREILSYLTLKWAGRPSFGTCSEPSNLSRC